MNKKIKRAFTVLVCLMLVIVISSGIILTTRALYKANHKTASEVIAENNEIILADESILYVDLTLKPEDYEKISVVENKNQEESTNQNEEDANTNNTEKNNININAINQKYFEVEVDLASRTAIADGTEMSISKLLGIAEDSKTLSSTDILYSYLEENVVGDITCKDGKININNPYSTNTIMMKTSKITELQDCGNVQLIVKVAEDVYCVHYCNAEDTKEGYNILKDNNLVENVCKDVQVEALDTEKGADITTLDSSVYTYGINETGLNTYKNFINNGNSKKEVKIAVLDTGVSKTHEVFTYEDDEGNTKSRLDLTKAKNYVDNNITSVVDDDCGHGTKVAGIIAQATSNNVKIIPIKVLDSEGIGKLSKVVEAIGAISNYVDVINISFGANEKENKLATNEKVTYESVFKGLYDSGILVVCAAGNDGEENVYYPASSTYTLAVSSINKQNEISTKSNYGSEIDFSAPGEEISVANYQDDHGYVSGSGTSFATPFITSAVALIKSENPEYTIEKIKTDIISNCDDLGETGKDKYYGNGIINFNRNKFSKPVITVTSGLANKWKKETTLEVNAVCCRPILKWKCTTTPEEPEEWRNYSSTTSTDVTAKFQVIQNGNYYFWFKDEEENITNKIVTVQYIDGTGPTISSNLKVTSNNDSKAEVSVTVQDLESGIAKIEWYYKNKNASEYKTIKETYELEEEHGTGETSVKAITKSFNVGTDLDANADNLVYAIIYDAVGNNSETSKVTITTSNSEAGNNTNTNSTVENTTNTTNNNTNTNSTVENTTNTTNNNTNINSTVENTTNTINNNTNTNSTVENTTNTINNNTNTSSTVENTTNTTINDTNSVSQNTADQDSKLNENTNIATGTVATTKNTSNNNQNNNNLNSIKGTTDNSISSDSLPNTGTKKIMVLAFIVIGISGVYAFIKYRKVKEVK